MRQIEMQATLEVTAGPCAGRKIPLTPGTQVRIGRTDKADIAMGEDTFLSSAHFGVEWSGQQCVVRDLGSSNGTFLNGERASEGLLREGDVITAGQSTFALKLTEPEPMTTLYTAVRMDETRAIPVPAMVPPPLPGLADVPPPLPAAIPPPLPGPALTRPQQALLDVLRGLADPIYAVLDLSAAQLFLDQAGDPKLESLSEHAGLIPVFAESGSAGQLISSGWGAGAGFFLTSHQPVTMVRNHLRRFQTLMTADGAEFQFQFFRPALLRAFLTTLNGMEAKTFFGPLSSIMSEGDTADELVLFIPGPSGVLEKKMPLRCD